MNKSLVALLIAQFLSAFADNAILFTIIALVMHSSNAASGYVPALQSSFLIEFVVLAPWVGELADNYPKAGVLIAANLLKMCGAGLLLLNIEPLLAYAVVGSGAAIYSPAKYGILPEIVKHDELVKANGWIEGSTILAILLGMLIGAKVADASIQGALLGAMGLFLVSSVFASFLSFKKTSSVPLSKERENFSVVCNFYRQIQAFLTFERARFVILGSALFWASAATLRVILVAWSPLVLELHSASDIAQLTLFLAIGIIIGSAVVPRLIPLEHLKRSRFAIYSMALFIIGLSFTENLWEARSALLLIGTAGGIFIVPINAALQELGQQSIGSGHAIALQGFFQNAAMLLMVGGYSFAATQQLNPIVALLGLGGLLLVATFICADIEQH